SSAGAAAGVLADLLEDVLRARAQRSLLQLAPSWVSDPDFEKTSVINQLIRLLWPQLSTAAEAAIRTLLAEAEARVEAGGVPGVAKLTLRRCTAGPAAPPQIGGIKVTGGWAPPAGGHGGGGGDGGGGSAADSTFPGDSEELVIEIDLGWAAEAEAELGVSFGLPGRTASNKIRRESRSSTGSDGGGVLGFLRRLPLPQIALPPLLLSLSCLQLRAVVRLVLGPLLPEPPYLADVSVTLLQPPILDARLGVGLDILDRSGRRRRRGQPPPSPRSSDAGGAGSGKMKGSSCSDADVGNGESGWTVDLMSLPVVGWVLRSAVQIFLQRTLLYPRHLVLHLVEGGGLPLASLPPPHGILRVRLRRAEGLTPTATRRDEATGLYGNGLYVTAQVDGGAAQRAPTRYGTRSISWEQELEEVPYTGGRGGATGPPTAGSTAPIAPTSLLVGVVQPDDSATSTTRNETATAVAAAVVGDKEAETRRAGSGDAGGGGGGGGFLFELPVWNPSRQALLLQLLRDQNGWEASCMGLAAIPIAALREVLRNEQMPNYQLPRDQNHFQKHHLQQEEGKAEAADDNRGADVTAAQPPAAAAADAAGTDQWIPVIVHLLPGGGGLCPSLAEHPSGAPAPATPSA
ncbi:hypothetical protein VaNZ11_007499, partial [Volvox africanus]